MNFKTITLYVIALQGIMTLQHEIIGKPKIRQADVSMFCGIQAASGGAAFTV